MVLQQESTTYSDAFSKLADGLTSDTIQRAKVGSFWEFLRDVWSQSFEHPEYFKAWHVGVVAEDIEYCLQNDLNYVAVLPRFHFKSTLLGHAFSVWRLLQATRDMSVLYLSYSDGMAQYHINEINKTVKRNPQLMEWMKNRNPKADFSFRYHVNKHPVDIMHGGLFSFKRGMHVNGALIADDVLRDPENPLNNTQITKVEDHFLTESMFIPLKGVPVIVLGTPMMPGDLLSKLQEDDRFHARVLPALDPEPGRRVLMPELYSEEWLLQQQKARPKSFASEFLLVPHWSTEAYFEGDDITKLEDENLINHPTTKKYQKVDPNEELFAGFDVGKKRHPSHLVIFRRIGHTIEQIHQSWLDGWNYSDQIEFLNEVAENYDITKGYVDNTRGELEDRGLDHTWWSMSFTLKSKNTMAQVFEQYVHGGHLKILKDERQKQQILSVNNQLKAPETPMGHGDAFFSIAMALLAAHESTAYSLTVLGDVQDWATEIAPDSHGHPTREGIEDTNLASGEPGPDKLIGQENLNADLNMSDCPNPNCTDDLCRPSFWVPENKLCLYCNYRG